MAPDFSKLNGLIPAVVQDADSKTVLMVGFMNEEAWKKTKKSKKVTFYSRTKQRLWTKGEESGNVLRVETDLGNVQTVELKIKKGLPGLYEIKILFV